MYRWWNASEAAAPVLAILILLSKESSKQFNKSVQQEQQVICFFLCWHTIRLWLSHGSWG